MKDQIEAIYEVANYLDDKCPSCGMFYYGVVPYIELKGIEQSMAEEVLKPHVKSVCDPVNLGVTVRTYMDENVPCTCVYIESALLVWDSIFPHRHQVPPYAPIEWLIRQLQEQLFPRVTGFTDDLT